MNTKNETLHSDIAWNALMQELRSIKTSSGSNENGSVRKKRRARFDQQDLSAAGGGVQERKFRCLRSSKTFSDVLGGSDSGTFLNLSPPSKKLDAEQLNFTFGRHYKSISLASLANSSCGCAGTPSQFDVFSTFRCPCKSRSSKTPIKSMAKKNASSASKKLRTLNAI